MRTRAGTWTSPSPSRCSRACSISRMPRTRLAVSWICRRNGCAQKRALLPGPLWGRCSVTSAVYRAHRAVCRAHRASPLALSPPGVPARRGTRWGPVAFRSMRRSLPKSKFELQHYFPSVPRPLRTFLTQGGVVYYFSRFLGPNPTPVWELNCHELGIRLGPHHAYRKSHHGVVHHIQ
jgi:hypothetical protein